MLVRSVDVAHFSVVAPPPPPEPQAVPVEPRRPLVTFKHPSERLGNLAVPVIARCVLVALCIVVEPVSVVEASVL